MAVTTWIAIFFAIRRIEFPDLPLPPWLAAALLPAAVTFAVAILLILGTGLFVVYCADPGLPSRVRRGAGFGACLAMLTIGWITINLDREHTGMDPYLALAAVVLLGALLGSLGGLLAPRLSRMLEH